MTESGNAEQEFLLDTNEIEVGDEKRKVPVDHERVFVPAGGIRPKDLKIALKKEHPPEKYPNHVVVFEVVKGKVVQVLITPKDQIRDYKKPE